MAADCVWELARQSAAAAGGGGGGNASLLYRDLPAGHMDRRRHTWGLLRNHCSIPPLAEPFAAVLAAAAWERARAEDPLRYDPPGQVALGRNGERTADPVPPPDGALFEERCGW